ncbi:MAG TPA: flavin reductase [Lachnospiraceae bacterium]|nr:flavin reductase [Lachnospiraceae bacterium]
MDVNIFRKMSYGVYIVSTLDGERPTGCIANSIMQITSSPATVAVSINHDNYTNGCIEKTGKFAFSIMAEDSDPGLIGNFGFRSGKDADKFEHVDYEMAEGIPVVKYTCGYVVCKVINKLETNTHTVFLGEVVDAKAYDGMGNAMTYAYYHEVVKGKSPKNAPTYLQEEKTEGKESAEGGKKTKYICQVCGYVYEGDALPEGYKCPICGVGADRFMAEQQ